MLAAPEAIELPLGLERRAKQADLATVLHGPCCGDLLEFTSRKGPRRARLSGENDGCHRFGFWMSPFRLLTVSASTNEYGFFLLTGMTSCTRTSRPPSRTSDSLLLRHPRLYCQSTSIRAYGRLYFGRHLYFGFLPRRRLSSAPGELTPLQLSYLRARARCAGRSARDHAL